MAAAASEREKSSLSGLLGDSALPACVFLHSLLTSRAARSVLAKQCAAVLLHRPSAQVQ